nr:RINT1-like protein isoform X4 [Bactrocera oleae]
MSKDLIEQRIIKFVNKEIGSDFKKLHRNTVLIENYKTSIEHLKQNLNEKNHADLRIFESALRSQHNANKSMELQKEKLIKFEKQLTPKIDRSNEALSVVLKDLGNIRRLQQLSHYMKIVLDIQEISQSLSDAVNGRDDAKTVNIYLTLFEDKDCENSVIGRLSNIESYYLKLFATETASYWHRILTDKFARFQFHFMGVRQTNRLDKPEWYFTQILNWSKEAHIFVGRTFQQSTIKAGIVDYNIRLEFIRGLVQMIIEKLTADIEDISRDEHLFAHLLDETLAFEAELRGNFGYPSSFPSVICVITQPAYLLKWISLEERFCAEKMDLILQGDDAWTIIDPFMYDNDLKIPKCVDQFIRLLEAIKERYGTLIQPGQQLQFLSLQLELIENFRRRLVQLFSSGVIEIISILNAINYLSLVLNEWGENIHYLHLHAALVGQNSIEIHSVFEQPVGELEHWIKKLIDSLATKAVNEIKAKSMTYRHDCWASASDQNCKEPFILSSSAGEMFQVMVTTLHNLERDLSLNLFRLTLRIIANNVDEFLFDSLVMNNKFTPAGAAQFNFDMTRNLFPLFGQYCRRPDLLFKKVHDSSKLLNAARGTALLLHEALISQTNLEQKVNALKELGIVNFKYETCIHILERRTDLKVL